MTMEPLEPPDPQPSFMGYSHEQLEAQFNLIKSDLHWKTPIELELPPHADLQRIAAAIMYFTGSSGEMIKDGDKTFVVAPGYWATVG